MNEEKLTHEEIKAHLRSGRTLHPLTPGLEEAARDLVRPVIEQMRGQEIIYQCRFNWLLRVTSLEVDARGFKAVGRPAQDPPGDLLSEHLTQPLTFGARWIALSVDGSAIGMDMIPDRFWPDPAVVAAVKAAAARAAGSGAPMALVKDVWREMREILEKPPESHA